MDKIDKFIMITIFMLSLVIFFFLNLTYDDSFYSNSVTFLSITIGFTMTSLSVLYNTDSIKKLAKSKDSEKKNYSALHRLGVYYHIQIVFSIFLILFYQLENLLINKFNLLCIFSFINFPLLLCNCYITIILINFFIKLFTHPNFGRGQ